MPESTRVGSNTSSPTHKSVGSVASLVDGLAERLKQNPDDSKSWLLLARSYRHLNRIPEARDAYNNAAAFGEYDAELDGQIDDAMRKVEQVMGRKFGDKNDPLLVSVRSGARTSMPGRPAPSVETMARQRRQRRR